MGESTSKPFRPNMEAKSTNMNGSNNWRNILHYNNERGVSSGNFLTNIKSMFTNFE